MQKFRLDIKKEKALVSWLEKSTGIKAMWDNQDAHEGVTNTKRPDLPYVLLSIISGPRKIGEADRNWKEDDTFTYTRHKEVTLSVNVYAKNNHLGIMETIQDSFDHDTVILDFKSAGLAYLSSTDPSDISFLMETKNEFRVTMDIIFGYVKITEDSPGEIRKVDIDYSHNDGDQTGALIIEV